MLSNIIKFEVIQGSFKSRIEFNITNITFALDLNK